MFLRLVRATVSKGVKREYVRVVEAYRDASGKTRHHTIINLGRRDLLARHLDLDKLARLLHGDARADRAVRRAGVAAIGAWDWGPVLAVRQLWNELGLDHVVAQGGGRGRGDGVSLSERALVLVANRLASPGSEHALAQWLETDFVCDRHGRRWIAAWRDEAERKASRTPRVRVAGRQLQQWYRTLDQLIECKAQIEHALYLRLRDLFSLQVDMVFYDLTSTYFEGKGPPEIGANGHSRDGKPRNPQVLVGLVMVDGWPIAHHVFAGNRRDAMTVEANERCGKACVRSRDHKIAVEQDGGADADRDPAHGRDHRLIAANERGQEAQHRTIEAACAFRGLDKIRQIVAGRERSGSACDQHAPDGIIRVRALERSRHRLVHGKRQRVFLVRTVHPDGAYALGIGY